MSKIGEGNIVPFGNLHYSQLNDPAMDLSKWDDFLAGNKYGHIFQTPHWAEYKQKTGWQPFQLSIVEQNSLYAICLVLYKSIAGFSYGGVLYVDRGPVLDFDTPEAPNILVKILAGLKKLAHSQMAVVRIRLNVKRENTWVEKVLQEQDFLPSNKPIGHTATIVLDLNQSLDQIIAGMQSQRRRKIKQYEKSCGEWQFCHENDSDFIESFYSLYHQTLTNAKKSPKRLDDIQCLYETLSQCGSCHVFLIKYQDQPVAGAFLIGTGQRIWYLYSGSLKGSDCVSGAGMYLQWELIKWAKNQGYTLFDLEGIPDPPVPDDPLYGVYCFKKRWGGEEVFFIDDYEYTALPFLGKILEWKLTH